MSRREFQEWREFYRLFPFDDLHRFHRPAALVATAASGGDFSRLEKRLAWLAPDPQDETYSDADLNTFKAFGIKPPGRG